MAKRSGGMPPIVVALALSAGGSLPVFLVGALSVDEGQSLALAPSSFSLLVSLFFAAAAVAALVGGRTADRMGGVAIIRVGTTVTLVGTALIALAGSVWLYSCGVVVAGLGYGVTQPAVSKFLADNVRLTRQGTAFGLRQTGVPIATVLTGVAVSATAANHDWRIAFAGAWLLSAVSLILLANHRPGEGATTAAGGARLGSGGTAVPRRSLLRLLGAALALGAGTIYVVASFAAPSARLVGLSPGYSGLIAAAGGLVALVSRVSAGVFADTFDFKPLRAAGTMLVLGSIGYLLLSIDAKALFTVGIFLAFSLGSGWNALFLLSLARDFPGSAGRASGVGLAGAYMGGVAGPLIFGFALSRFGFSVAWGIVAVMAGVAGVVALSGSRMLRGAS